MQATDVLTTLTALGCQVSPDGDTLRVLDPHHALRDELRQAIRTHKAALLALLTTPAPAERRIPLPRYPAPCWWCKGPSERQGLRYLLCPTCQAKPGAYDSLPSG